MNTKSIQSAQVKSLPYFPELTGGKTTRVVTKHFTNLAMYMHQQSYSLLSWLIYQSRADNTIIYSTQLLTKFKESISAAHQTYTPGKPFKADIKVIRGVFKQLIENGYILPTWEDKMYMISPMLSYHPEYLSAAKYKGFCVEYQDLHNSNINPEVFRNAIRIFTERYLVEINRVIGKKVVK